MRPTTAIGAGLCSLALLLAGCSTPTDTTTASPTGAAVDSGPAALTVTDAAGRTVTFDKMPERIVFGEQRQAYASMILNKEHPLAKVVAWGTDMERAAPDMYARLAKVEPAAATLPRIGSVASGDLSVEAVLAHRPDVYVMTLDTMRAAERNGLLAQFDQAGLKYVVTDFRIDPAKNTAVTMRALGALLGRSQQAEEFLDYYRTQVDPVLATAVKGPRPTTLMWRAPGVKACCSTWKDVNFGQMLEQAGGDNIADRHLSGEEGDLTAEQVVADQPDVVIATGGAWSKQKFDPKAATSFLHIGYDTTEEQARTSLAALRKQPGFDHLTAFSSGRVHGIYHQFYDAPFNFVAYQAFAAWQQPRTFDKLDPQKSWEDFSRRFMPFPAEGTVVVDLEDGDAA